MGTTRSALAPGRTIGHPTQERRVYRGQQLLTVGRVPELDPAVRAQMSTVAEILPFKVNGYIVDQLIDWEHFEADPIYHLVFPQPEMLPEEMHALATQGGGRRGAVDPRMWAGLNPDPNGQLRHNVPVVGGRPLSGVQHKYHETILVFPAGGQTCHAHCGYCFRWPQFRGGPATRHALSTVDDATAYLAAHPEVTDVLLTGGDPLTMDTTRLAAWIDAIVRKCPSVRNVRIGTKSLTYWPYRFTHDPDADDLMRLFERVVGSGRALHLMAHLSHPQEMRTDAFAHAVARIRATGATIRSQAPVVRHVNDSSQTWAQLWRRQVQLGIQPYYMFVDRPTGAFTYYALPLHQALKVYWGAINKVSGLARTARGPVMSATEGKICVDGLTTVAGRRYFVTRMLQARDAADVGRIQLYDYDPQATWVDQLTPAAG